MRAAVLGLATAALVLAPLAAWAKPPPHFCNEVQNKPECAWWQAQRQWAPGQSRTLPPAGESCCGAPGSDGHVLTYSEWRTTDDPRFPFSVLVHWSHLGAKHETWMLVPAAVVVPPQDLPEPNGAFAAHAKVWYAPSWRLDGSPDPVTWRWYCMEPVEGS